MLLHFFSQSPKLNFDSRGCTSRFGKVRVLFRFLWVSRSQSHHRSALVMLMKVTRESPQKSAAYGADEGIRTPNPQFRRLMLYPLSYVRAWTDSLPVEGSCRGYRIGDWSRRIEPSLPSGNASSMTVFKAFFEAT